MSIILILLGLINAIYLQFIHNSSTLTCAAGSGCSDVLSSSYASVLGIPLASFGIGLYLILLVINALRVRNELDSNTSTSLSLVLLTPATAIGLILLAIQFIDIKAFCLFCTFNTLLLLILFGLTYKQYLSSKSFTLKISLSQLIALVTVFLLPILFNIKQSKTSNMDYIVGEVAGEFITVNQIPNSDFASKWERNKQKEYAIKKEFFELSILELAAKKADLSVRAFIDQEILPSVKISDQQIIDFYNENKDDIPSDKTFEEIKPSIKKYLLRKEESFAIKEYIKNIYADFDATLLAKRVLPNRIYSNRHRSYSMGNPNAPIKIVEFSDLECGYCKRAYVEMKKIIKDFKNKVYFEYRHYPLEFHPFSKQFSIASVCAGEQDKFFDFIEISFANQESFSTISPESLAEKINLNIDEFNQCLKEDLALRVVNQDIHEGNRLNVNGTPTFFINGHLFNGIPTAEDLFTFL